MATGGWGASPGQTGGDGQPGGQGWGGGPAGPPANNPYGPAPTGGAYGRPGPGPYPGPNPNPYPGPNTHPGADAYPQPGPYPYGPQSPAPAPVRAPRRRSRLWYFSVFFLAAAIIRSAHRVATRLFVQEGDGRIEDRAVDRVQVARTVLGAAATLALILVYGVEADRWENAAADGIGNLIIAPVLLICTGPLVILGFIHYAPAHQRPHLRSRLRAPLKAVGWYLLTVLVIGGVLYGTALMGIDDRKDWVAIVVVLVATAVILWGFPFFFLASLYSARSAFNTAHVHPMLPPVVTMVLVWVLAVFNLAYSGMSGGPAGGPVLFPAGRTGVGDRCFAVGDAADADPLRGHRPRLSRGRLP
ncbi:hypothetical protein ACHBTE_00165 [Streptomyces sp. M41]|uniref:hypothetical protein n=1 Tax=Streptomyces sp. M41 TaxID=3059412 RepID=UPI00374D0556